MRGFVASNVAIVAGFFLVGGVIVPYIAAWVAYGQIPSLRRPGEFWEKVVRPRLTRSQKASGTPTAWDYGIKTARGGWVRVRIGAGVWVGGLFEEGSRFSTYPEPRDIFVSQQWNMGQAGEFESAVVGSQGVWLAVKDDYVVEWLQAQEVTEDAQTID